MALDPVCGMTVDPARAAGTVEHKGTTYYFCSKSCAARFAADPQKYLSGTRESMHAPQVLTIGGLKKQSPNPSPQSPSASSQPLALESVHAVGCAWVSAAAVFTPCFFL